MASHPLLDATTSLRLTQAHRLRIISHSLGSASAGTFMPTFCGGLPASGAGTGLPLSQYARADIARRSGHDDSWSYGRHPVVKPSLSWRSPDRILDFTVGNGTLSRSAISR